MHNLLLAKGIQSWSFEGKITKPKALHIRNKTSTARPAIPESHTTADSLDIKLKALNPRDGPKSQDRNRSNLKSQQKRGNLRSESANEITTESPLTQLASRVETAI